MVGRRVPIGYGITLKGIDRAPWSTDFIDRLCQISWRLAMAAPTPIGGALRQLASLIECGGPTGSSEASKDSRQNRVSQSYANVFFPAFVCVDTN